MTIDALVPNSQAPGGFLRARKARTLHRGDPADHRVYSIVTGRQAREIDDSDLSGPRYLRLVAVLQAKGSYRKLKKSIRGF